MKLFHVKRYASKQGQELHTNYFIYYFQITDIIEDSFIYNARYRVLRKYVTLVGHLLV